jgi:deoxyribodipyrimidine photo-lyase
MKKALVWFRRDLRLHDHAALHQALLECDEIHLVFIFDQNILDKLPGDDRRVTFLHESLVDMNEACQGKLIVKQGNPLEIIPSLVTELGITDLYINRDYEPYAKKRDEHVTKTLKKNNVQVHTFKDHVFFEKHEVLTGSQGLYKVFTPYKNEWIKVFHRQEDIVNNYECKLKKIAVSSSPLFFPKGFIPQKNVIMGGTKDALKKLKKFKPKIEAYQENRDIPILDGTSGLSPYIRFGNLSVRDMIRTALEALPAEKNIWLSEIIWRDFYQMILDAHPHVVSGSFKKEYDKIKWTGSEKNFQAWCEGKTGFPIVDAAMRCLNETGLMHNRLRMIVASFLCKTLLVDWKKGEEYFALKLMDFDLAANNGGWQWSSSTGCDAQPYFRIFNPYSQQEKFDPELKFIKKYIPEIGSPDYCGEIVDYKEMREKALALYASAKAP